MNLQFRMLSETSQIERQIPCDLTYRQHLKTLNVAEEGISVVTKKQEGEQIEEMLVKLYSVSIRQQKHVWCLQYNMVTIVNKSIICLKICYCKYFYHKK